MIAPRETAHLRAGNSGRRLKRIHRRCFLLTAVRTWILISLAAVGCTTDDVPSVAIISPAPGASFARDVLADSGALVASVPIQLDVGGNVAKVTVTRDDIALGDANDEGALTVQLPKAGAATLTATAFDAAGAVLVTASVDVAVTEPQVESCHGWLDLYKLDYTTGPANQGIADPVTVKAPINGVAYRYNGSMDQRKTVYGDCELLKSLAEAAPILRANDVKEFVDIGIYNYRCIDQSLTPPNCSMSQHAYAKAIDIAAFITSDDTKYSVLTDWLIDPASTTCTAATEPGKDAFLHKVICELKAAGVWNIVLTPNYNAAHRNHFHVDLTEDADTIKREVPTNRFDMDHRLVVDGTTASSLLVD